MIFRKIKNNKVGILLQQKSRKKTTIMQIAAIRCNFPPTITDAVVQNENRELILQKTIQKLNTIISISKILQGYTYRTNFLI